MPISVATRKEGRAMNLLLFVVLLVLSVGLFRSTDWYREHGRRVVATVTRITLLAPVLERALIEGQNLGWRIFAEWTDPETQKTYKFKGTATRHQTRYTVGDDIYVFIDPNNMKHYHLEVDEKTT
jgi:hypothetical protein